MATTASFEVGRDSSGRVRTGPVGSPESLGPRQSDGPVGQVRPLRDVSPTSLAGRPFRALTGQVRVSFGEREHALPVLYLNHPSSIRFNRRDDREDRIRPRLVEVVRDLCRG